MHHFYEPNIINGAKFLNEEESKHALKVLRLQEGDIIEVMDGLGSLYNCRIVKTGKTCSFTILQQKTVSKTLFPIHIAIAPTKNQERMEWFIEKVTEIGIDSISFIITKNSERNRIRIDRIIKKAIGAMKQSMNLWLPEINEEIPFTNFIAKYDEVPYKFIAYVDDNHPSHLMDMVSKKQPTLVLIGPEGDFTPSEIEIAIKAGYKPVSLGASRLRTETAGIVACHIINLHNR